MHDPQLRQRLAKAGRQRVLEHFTQARIAADTVAVYRQITPNSQKPHTQYPIPDTQPASRTTHHAPRSTLHIALNAHLLSLEAGYRGAGIHRYIHALLDHLPRVSSHRFSAYVGDPRVHPQQWPDLAIRKAPFPTAWPPLRILWEQTLQPLALLRDGVDLVHGLAYALPLLCPVPAVVTVHDLSFLLFPGAFHRGNRLYLTLATRLAVRRADAVIAVSRHTARDLVRLLGVPEKRIHVVPNGVDPEFRPLEREEIEAFRQRRGLPERFILYVGTIEPRKNLDTLVRAYAQLVHRDPQHAVPLIIAGARGWRYEGVFALVEELGLDQAIHFPGFIDHSELPLWYNAASVFVFPSLYEGFGLPVLEAMACGTPVVASRASSLPEVVGEAGLLVDPHDAEALAEALWQALADPALREALRTQGLARAAGYSWQATAAQTAAVYQKVALSSQQRAISNQPAASD
jgi:glycosyltransferase involved in cell wall biosynthesis